MTDQRAPNTSGRRRRHLAQAAALAITTLATACGATDPAAEPPATTPAAASPSAPTTTTPRTMTTTPLPQPTLDAIAARYRDACRSPGAAVGVRTADGATHLALAGELAPGVPITADSQFLAGSVTKLFVATVAYRLIADGRLSLDDTVDRFLPDWPRGDQITVAMLLGHRSGMGDFGNDFSAQLRDLVLADLTRRFTYDEVLALIRDIPPVAAPGATYHYTNANTIVLGAILQRVTGQSLGRLMTTQIVEPLALDHTIYGPDDVDAAEAVVFHGLYDIAGTGNPIDIGGVPRAAALTVDPAGAGLFSTVPDLLTAAHALFATDAVLAEPQRAQLAEHVSTLTAADLLLDPTFEIHGHGGASPGAQTIVAVDATHGTTVAVWCNRLDPGEHELLPSVFAAKEALEAAAGP